MIAHVLPHDHLRQAHFGTDQRLFNRKSYGHLRQAQFGADERLIDSKAYGHLKRMLDLLLCILGLPFVLIVLIICAILIKFDSPEGPIFFIQERVGQHGRRFRMYKFRTLRPDYDERHSRELMRDFVAGQMVQDESSKHHSIHKPFSKSQITRVGRFLRATSLDELPQVINVLRGEMSLVGPRPNVPWETDAYKKWHWERQEVLPGITGLAQVLGRSSISFIQIARADIRYVRTRSLKFDLQILWWTVSSVLSGRGAG